MKRLFRTSKAGTVDPLPPPPPPPQTTTPFTQSPGPPLQPGNVVSTPQPYPPGPPRVPPKKSGGNDGRNHELGSGDNHRSHHHHHQHSHAGSRPRQGSVTPFPLDMGRDGLPPPPQHIVGQPGPQQQQPQHRSKNSSSVSSPPSLLEIQQMQAAQAAQADIDARRDAWLASQRQGTPPAAGNGHANLRTNLPPPSRPGQVGRYDNTSPDGWSVISNPALPTPASGLTGGSNASTPTIQQTQLYLPPGARPPSPQVRPATPTRPSYPSSLGHHSQSSLQGYADIDPYTTTTAPKVGRDRGYSSASGSVRGSDQEGSAQGHSHSHSHSHSQSHSHSHSQSHGMSASPGTNKMPVPKPAQPFGSRSPLSNAYATPTSPDPAGPPYAVFPTAQAAPYLPPPVDEMSAIRIEGPSPDATEVPLAAQSNANGKEKKKFWGMGMEWGNKKDKDKEKDKHGRNQLERPSMDEYRRSTEWPRGEEVKPGSSHGHVSTTEEESMAGGHGYGAQGQARDHPHRGRMLGLDIGGRIRDSQGPASVDNVTAAIQILCAHPDPPFASTYEVCDRINHSTSPESVGKEAAHALRKQFKHGSDGERRSAANLWLLMMRNVTAKGFRTHATSKKFVAVLEPILLASPAKPVVSPATHRVIADILSDLTYNFGPDKGTEALVELWRKVKLPQEPDMGSPLPTDFQAFNPENYYARGMAAFDSNSLPSVPSSVNASRRASSPNGGMLGVNDRSVPPPVPHRGPSPLHMGGGPGYANLPSHGDDMRRLVDECTAAKESARVLAEALVFTSPEDLDKKPIIKEFYRKCFLAFESLTGQMGWAQAEASHSRERAVFEASANGYEDAPPGNTAEEDALNVLLGAHHDLSEALKQHDDLERQAVDELEMKEARERSKKDTRMDRMQAFEASNELLRPTQTAGGSTSRSPSPTPHARLPQADALVASPRAMNAPTPLPVPRPFGSDVRSRTPSPDSLRQPRIPPSPGRAGSPLGQSVLAKAKGPRPLPNPFSRSQNPSNRDLPTVGKEGGTPSRSGTDSTDYHGQQGASAQPALANGDVGADDNDSDAPPVRPSRKALGKRRVIEDPDNDFNPDDMFGLPKPQPAEPSDESVTAASVYRSRPVKYAYDAYQERLDQEAAQQLERSRASRIGAGAGSGGGGSGSTGGGSAA